MSLDGFGEDAPFASDAHLGLHAYLAPFGKQAFDPVLSVGVLFPMYGNPPGVLFQAELGMPVATVADHPFTRMFRRDSAWVPSLHGGVVASLAEYDAVALTLTVQPLLFDFGEKTVGILGMHLIYDWLRSNWRWGIRLVQVSQALY